MSFLKNNSRFLFILLILVVGSVYFLLNPADHSFFPACPFKSITGLNCPGCGSQRAFHQLLHLNFKKAFEYNALMVISIPYAVLAMAFGFRGVRDRFPKANRFLFGLNSLLLILGIIVFYFIFRNL
ncbi:DUF2752 domain-containing protein [Chryseobacterium koreense]|uniref:DUF2752 domain-containing protein n=1 Tax=Chryseobacterium koreense CCUG 49689 TaxID=1304281 RepID=A0A0J7LQI1_9FLAO|nr:DUF2752 domain-containing protein [Chryseobacterium koreense]KMQ71315.1 hypothetical protein ACM44_07915 [Chryseobacterium koreense CCUG 49689]MBB5333921.1 hypothetical protein [Chryseobacterium koreense]